MTTLSTLFGDKFNRDPRKLPLFQTQYGNRVYMKVSYTGSVADNDGQLWTQIGNNGAYATQTANDTFITVCDIAGSGFLLGVLPPTIANTNVITMRITVDGIVYTISRTDNDSASDNCRLYLGGAYPNNSPLSSGNSVGFDSYSVDGALAKVITGVTKLSAINLIPTVFAFSAGFPSVRFDTSLKIECKNSVLPSGNGAKAGALYFLDA